MKTTAVAMGGEYASSHPAAEPWKAGLAVLAARQVLAELGELAPDAEVALQRAVEARLEEAQETLSPPAGSDTGNEQHERGGMHERDASAVAFLGGLGLPDSELRVAGDRAADQWAQGARESWLAFRNQAALPGPRSVSRRNGLAGAVARSGRGASHGCSRVSSGMARCKLAWQLLAPRCPGNRPHAPAAVRE